MNSENENRAYPCDEPETKRSYPCDEAFYNASENSGNEDLKAVKGKGRRGGNAAASVVVHSGKFRENTRQRSFSEGEGTDRREDRGERRSFNRDDRREDRGERRSFNRDDRREDRGERRSFNRDDHREDRGERRSFGRDDRREDRGERRSFGRDDRREDRGERRSFGRDDRREDRGERRGFGRDDRREDRGERRSFGRDDRREDRGERRSFGRDDRREDRGERRGFGRNDRRDSRRDFGGSRPKAPESVFSRAYTVMVETTSEVGAFVGAPDEIMNGAYGRKVSENKRVLLPFAEQIGRPKAGEQIEVYFYEDKGGRLTCTMRTPILKDGEVGILRVADSTSIGVFLDNGVPKQILLPFKEQIVTPEVGDEVLVWIYSDKSGRQAATMRVYGHLQKNSPYKEDDHVSGFVYEINPKLGIFVAVDNKYYGLIPVNETFKEYAYGDEIEARVAKVREDGKLDLLVREKLYLTVQEDADVILYELRRNNGFLPYGDRADAEFIEETYAMSKNQFKRALGHLYKNHIVDLDREADTVTLLKKD